MKPIRILVCDGSTIRGHHSLYLNGTVKAFETEGYKVFLVAPDIQRFQFVSGVGTSVSRLELPFDLHIRFIAAILSVVSVRGFQKVIFFLQVRRLARQHKIDHIFFPHLDSVVSPSLPNWVYRLMPRTWSGIYIRPFETRGDLKWNFFFELLAIDRLKKVLVLDELLFHQLPPASKAEHLPELLLSTAANKDFYARVFELKNGRIAVSLIGSFNRRKRLLEFLEVSRTLRSDRFFVVLAGLLPREEYSLDELNYIDTQINGLREKDMAYVHLDYIENEDIFHALYRITDIIWLNYANHPYTSNAIVNALHYKMKVVSNLECRFIAHLWNKYRFPVYWGTAPAPTDLEMLAEGHIEDEEYVRFQQDFSFDQFKAKILQSV